MTKKHDVSLPPHQWYRGMETISDFVAGMGKWEQQLREHMGNIHFTHELLVPDDGSGGHQNEEGAFFCGEACCIEELPNGTILAFFWTGERIPENAHYRHLPRTFLLFDKKTGKEDPRSVKRRSTLR